MTTILQIGKRAIAADEVLPLLTSYQMVPQLLRESIIDDAIASITCTTEEIDIAYEQFYQQNQLTTETQKQAWLQQYCFNQKNLEAGLITRMLKVEKFKYSTWGHKLETYFLQRKTELDQAVYSLIRTKDEGVADELFFRLQAQEQTFAQIAYQYSEGPEAESGGIIGPLELGNIHPKIAQFLLVSQPNQVWPPLSLGDWLLIIRLERLIPAQLDGFMRQRLLHELFETWLQEQINQLSNKSSI